METELLYELMNYTTAEHSINDQHDRVSLFKRDKLKPYYNTGQPASLFSTIAGGAHAQLHT